MAANGISPPRPIGGRSNRVQVPTRSEIIQRVAALVHADGAMPTFEQARKALGDAVRADQCILDEFGRYDALFKAVRAYLQSNQKPVILGASPSAAPAAPLPPSSLLASRSPTSPSRIPPPLLFLTTPSELPRRRPQRDPAVHTLQEIVARVNRVGIVVEDPVELLFLSILRNTQDRPTPMPAWGDWRSYVGFSGKGLVGQLQNLQLLSNGGKVEEKAFAMIEYERREVNGDWQLTNVELYQANRLEDLPQHPLAKGEGRMWFMRCGTSSSYDWLALGGEWAEELPTPAEYPHAKWRPGAVVVAPDAAAIDRSRQQLAKLLRDRSFEGIAESRMPPLFTPAELKRVELLITRPVELRQDARGFAPSAVEWKDLALRPSDRRFAGHLPEISPFEALVIGVIAFWMGVRTLRVAPVGSFTAI